ncbi:hypothetical protein [Streptomyces sp. NPDC059604]|uniref:hypothetical protein n=1 Tax=Streptomyces sp. NPDC059604 TaxID=3346881 RepID=UPI0036956E28
MSDEFLGGREDGGSVSTASERLEDVDVVQPGGVGGARRLTRVRTDPRVPTTSPDPFSAITR